MESTDEFRLVRGLSGEKARKFEIELNKYERVDGKKLPLGVGFVKKVFSASEPNFYRFYHIKGASAYMEFKRESRDVNRAVIEIMSGSDTLNQRALTTLESMIGIKLR